MLKTCLPSISQSVAQNCHRGPSVGLLLYQKDQSIHKGVELTASPTNDHAKCRKWFSNPRLHPRWFLLCVLDWVCKPTAEFFWDTPRHLYATRSNQDRDIAPDQPLPRQKSPATATPTNRTTSLHRRLKIRSHEHSPVRAHDPSFGMARYAFATSLLRRDRTERSALGGPAQ
jgi:hypothetical protein